MRFVTKDIDLYLQAKEYVDTALIPLMPVTWGSQSKNAASIAEFMNIMTMEIERQFKGRIVLFPPFTYLMGEDEAARLQRLGEWEAEIKENGMKHILFFTSDSAWKSAEDKLESELIWFPSLPLEHVEEKYLQSIIGDQMKQLMPVFMNKWSRG